MDIFSGKIHYEKYFTLSVKLITGYMFEFNNWVPEQIGDFDFSISVDSNILFRNSMDQMVTTLDLKIPDPESVTDHVLKFEMHRVPPVIKRNNKTYHPVIKIDNVQFDSLAMNRLLEDDGQCVFYNRPFESNNPGEFIGETGYYSLNFQTPIYPWLLKNEKKPDYYY